MMGQTMHDAVKAALIRQTVEEDCFGGLLDWIDGPEKTITPEKYKRMWKKITGKNITIEQAREALKGS